MKFALFDDPMIRRQLLPFTYTRPVAEIRWGIFTLTEKWEAYLNDKVDFITEDYLSGKFAAPNKWSDLVIINGAVTPSEDLLNHIHELKTGSSLTKNEVIIAARIDSQQDLASINRLPKVEYKNDIDYLSTLWQIFKEAGDQIRLDYKLLTNNRSGQEITDPNTIVYNSQNIFVEEGVSLKAVILDADKGPIYLGKNSTIEHGAVIRGPFALGEGSTINSNAVMRGDISIGPQCKVGGEVSNVIILGYSNKGHEGFLGNSVVGEWCNIGAGTISSNLKNNYAMVKVWDYTANRFINSGEQFCGLMMGDHCKTGIGTMLNTGTVVGVAANIFGPGFPRNFIPSFSWGGHTGFTTFRTSKVKEMATVSMARRIRQFNETEEAILNHVFDETRVYRTWEKDR